MRKHAIGFLLCLFVLAGCTNYVLNQRQSCSRIGQGNIDCQGAIGTLGGNYALEIVDFEGQAISGSTWMMTLSITVEGGEIIVEIPISETETEQHTVTSDTPLNIDTTIYRRTNRLSVQLIAQLNPETEESTAKGIKWSASLARQ